MHVKFPEYEADTSFIQTRRIAIVVNKGADTATVTTSADGSPAIV